MYTGLPAKKDLNECIYCASKDLVVLLKTDRMPYSSQILFKELEQARECRTESLRVVFCSKCFLIYNQDYFSRDKNQPDHYHDDNYYSSVCASSQASEDQKRLAVDLNDIWGLKGKNICEIGCGDGNFLNEMSQYCSKAIGYEPSPTFHLARQNQRISVKQSYLDDSNMVKELGERDINMFVVRHVLEHLPDPLGYLQSLTRLFSSQEDSAVFLEVPDGAYLIENNLYFDFYPDHVYYFTPSFLYKFLRQVVGWKKVIRLNSGPKEFIRMLMFNQGPAQDFDIDLEAFDSKEFSEDFYSWKKQLTDLLKEISDKEKKVAVWGAGSRGVTMLTALGLKQGAFKYVVDCDPNKLGRFIPMLGVSITSPASLEQDPVDYLLVTSYTYFDEIVNGLNNHRSKGLKIIKPYPTVSVI